MRFRTKIKHREGSVLEFDDGVIELQPGKDGYCEFDTTTESIIRRLLAIPEGFQPIGDDPEEHQPPAGANPFVITDGTSTIDLTDMTDEQMRQFIADNEIAGIHHRAKGDTLRTAIVRALGAAS